VETKGIVGVRIMNDIFDSPCSIYMAIAMAGILCFVLGLYIGNNFILCGSSIIPGLEFFISCGSGLVIGITIAFFKWGVE
jgi:xanthosine utilization system XapX-like protein